jgi:cytochrome c biogenesis protein CcdA/thiol-disulfide isomerase/thioredoxin
MCTGDMVFTAFVSLVAGLLTVLAPCVLPLLPVILGGSVLRDDRDRWRPFIITGSLVASLVLFTLLLKVSTVFIHVDPRVWTYLSGGIILVLGVSMLFPGLWPRVAEAVGLERRSQALLQKAHGHRNKTVSAVLTGAALGPVFSSCSPTYAWVIATVLPASPAVGMVYLSVYCVGVGAGLLAIALLGRRLLGRITWASKPGGAFQRTIASLFIVMGLFIVTGLDQAVETRLLTADPFGITRLEQRLVPSNGSEQPPIQMSPGDVASYPAPELEGIKTWINSDPLTLAQLKGKVVLIDFWTYSCINCIRTQPYLNAWYDTYAPDGLVIIGVHAPEFAFEQVPANVQKAVTADGIKYPVALDNGFATWKAYANNYWPAKYLIDRDGRVRYTQNGEGAYDVTEAKIRQLLGESASTKPMVQVTAEGPGGANQTPETYLGRDREERYVGKPGLGGGSTYTEASVGADEWTLGGAWDVASQAITAVSDGATLTLKYTGRDVYLVMGAPPGSTVRVAVDSSATLGSDVGPNSTVTLSGPRMYRLVESRQSSAGATLRLTFSQGVSANAFTFG